MRMKINMEVYMLSWEEAAKFSEINNFDNQVTVSETYYTTTCPVYDSFKVLILERSTW